MIIEHPAIRRSTRNKLLYLEETTDLFRKNTTVLNEPALGRSL